MGLDGLISFTSSPQSPTRTTPPAPAARGAFHLRCSLPHSVPPCRSRRTHVFHSVKLKRDAADRSASRSSPSGTTARPTEQRESAAAAAASDRGSGARIMETACVPSSSRSTFMERLSHLITSRFPSNYDKHKKRSEGTSFGPRSRKRNNPCVKTIGQ